MTLNIITSKWEGRAQWSNNLTILYTENFIPELFSTQKSQSSKVREKEDIFRHVKTQNFSLPTRMLVEAIYEVSQEKHSNKAKEKKKV